METKSDYVITTTGLSKVYNGLYALKDLSLKVQRKSIFAFLGPNGAGKTTTIKLLMGLIRPTTGSGEVLGYDIVLKSGTLRKFIGYMAQDQGFYPSMSPYDVLNFTARFYFKGQKEHLDERVQEMLELVKLEEMASRPVEKLSGGELQRLGIAQALISNPPLLILDEPASGLDPHGREDVLSLMKQLKDQTTIFYSTHILDDVQRVSDTVAIINRGTLIAQAPIDNILRGRDGIVYSVKIKGDATRAYERVASQDWVSSIHSESDNGTTHWDVSVSDESLAEDLLLKLIQEDNYLTLLEFKQHEYELEEVFMRLVEESNNGN